ncbi:hypothetical protein BS47DRAFT_1362625 [Hydnum rufescens UP504]|uniref:Uncharacterized protein n=1 Tax=Hydnum rufescens UP504 TaxID=1448309 RepID=A0A9P6AWE8_9AGAM|nr:hypothetical protein BS47DRAFT_1362625 [Hydnum rufescens UP504]
MDAATGDLPEATEFIDIMAHLVIGRNILASSVGQQWLLEGMNLNIVQTTPVKCTHHCMVLKERGMSKQVASSKGCNWVHWDISPANIYLVKGVGKLGDLEFVQPFMDLKNDLGFDVGCGYTDTVQLLASEVQLNNYMYATLTPEQDGNPIPFTHNPLHDTESLWRMCIWHIDHWAGVQWNLDLFESVIVLSKGRTTLLPDFQELAVKMGNWHEFLCQLYHDAEVTLPNQLHVEKFKDVNSAFTKYLSSFNAVQMDNTSGEVHPSQLVMPWHGKHGQKHKFVGSEDSNDTYCRIMLPTEAK